MSQTDGRNLPGQPSSSYGSESCRCEGLRLQHLHYRLFRRHLHRRLLLQPVLTPALALKPALRPTVDRLVTIGCAECLGCMQCVAVCPAEGALHMSAPQRRPVPPWAMAAAMLAIFFGVYAWAQAADYWHSDIPAWVYTNLIPRAREFSHP